MVVLNAPGIVLDIISKTILKSYTNCIEGAANTVQFNLHAGGNITIDNCNITASASDGGFPGGCNAKPINADMEAEGTAQKLSKLLDDAIIAKAGMGSQKSQFITKIVDTVTNVSSETCAAVAINAMVFNASAGGNISIDGCNIAQTASANIMRCAHNTLVPSSDGKTMMPLSMYVQNEIQNSENYAGVQDPSSGAVQPAVPDCADPTVARYIALFGYTLVFITLLLFIMIPIQLLVRRYKHS